MENICSIIYANRNRDPARIKLSFESLHKQSIPDFEVIFVDYGSDNELVKEYQEIAEYFGFVRFFHLHTSHLLWNKSKALNYGIKEAQSPFIFIADVDLIFHPDTIRLFRDIRASENFFLFKLGYLDKKTSLKLTKASTFINLDPSRFGDVNGMILASKQALIHVNGLDEFFHFYGAEDEDLFCRLENAGYQRAIEGAEYFYHNWHESFSSGSDSILSLNPRIKNAMRINQRHFHWNIEAKTIKPVNQKELGATTFPDSDKLKTPDLRLETKNIYANVEHLLEVELPVITGKVVEVTFREDDYYKSLKHNLKRFAGKQTQPYTSMKNINDMILKNIVFRYRDHNYSYKISADRKRIVFCISL